MKLIILLTTITLSTISLAQIKCNVVNIEQAKECAIYIAKEITTENDDNAAFVNTTKKSKKLLIELLQSSNIKFNINEILSANYLVTIVQNNDEEHLHYFTLNKGKKIVPMRISGEYGINTVDLPSDICTMESLSKKYTKVSKLLLGSKADRSLLGTVWLEDYTCEDY